MTDHISQRSLVLVAGGYLLILRFAEVIPFSMFMYRYLEPGRAGPHSWTSPADVYTEGRNLEYNLAKQVLCLILTLLNSTGHCCMTS